MNAWLMLAVGDDRQHGGNDGYDDNPSAHYSWDDTVPNHAAVRPGDRLAIWDKHTLLGISTIESIEEGRMKKQFHACRDCGKAGIKERKTKRPRYRCHECGSTFDRPRTRTRPVTTFRSRHDIAWIDLAGLLPAPELRALCTSPRSQLSIRPLDWARFEQAVRRVDPTVRFTVTDVRSGEISGGHRTATARVRVGQEAFRKRLLQQFENVCALTGPAPRQVLEAAHLYRYSERGRHHDDGGFLLRRDVHRLFDLGQIAVDPQTMKIDVGDDLLPFADYACLQSRTLQVETTPGHRRWLQEHWRLHRSGPSA
jgi:ribosomal protein L37AE/L43A